MVKLVPLVPDIRSTKELISTFKGLTFPKNNKIGTQKLSDIRSIQKENEGKIQKTQESLIYT